MLSSPVVFGYPIHETWYKTTAPVKTRRRENAAQDAILGWMWPIRIHRRLLSRSILPPSALALLPLARPPCKRGSLTLSLSFYFGASSFYFGRGRGYMLSLDGSGLERHDIEAIAS
eukprot:3214282-Rhodomonas_salina.3